MRIRTSGVRHLHLADDNVRLAQQGRCHLEEAVRLRFGQNQVADGKKSGLSSGHANHISAYFRAPCRSHCTFCTLARVTTADGFETTTITNCSSRMKSFNWS